MSDRQADFMVLGHPGILDPNWPYLAARELGVERAAWMLPVHFVQFMHGRRLLSNRVARYPIDAVRNRNPLARSSVGLRLYKTRQTRCERSNHE